MNFSLITIRALDQNAIFVGLKCGILIGLKFARLIFVTPYILFTKNYLLFIQLSTNIINYDLYIVKIYKIFAGNEREKSRIFAKISQN